MRKALAVVAIAALTLGAAGGADAAVKKKPTPKLPKAVPLVLADPQGDANGINDQEGLLPAAPPEQSTPQGERSAADILSWSLGRVDDGKQITAVTASMTLAAAPDQLTDYRIEASSPTCPIFWFEVEILPQLGTDGYLRNDCVKNGSSVFDKIVDVKISGNTITWTLPVKSFPAGVKLGQALSGLFAATHGDEAAVIVGTIDQSSGADKTFKLGQ